MFSNFSRRTFARAIGASAAALSLPSTNASAQRSNAMLPRQFPKGFLWGSATASYQVEGAVHEQGRGPSIWDTFSHTPGKTSNGDTGDISADYFHRYPEDIRLMRELGLKTCRFSIAWSRVFPTGTGAPNPQGLDFYNRMIDALLGAGIQPYCTLYHWDLPQPLQDKGGWENPDTPRAFADYAGYTAGKLSNKVHHFMTMNEMRTFVEVGNRDGVHAPGLRLDPKRLAQLTHYVVLGHGLAVQAIRAHTPPTTTIGIADNANITCPTFEAPAQIAAARKAFREENAQYLTVCVEGRYTDLYLQRLGPNAPTFTPEEMKIIGSPMDFIGLNVYGPTWVRPADTDKGYAVIPNPASYPHMYSPWLNMGPECLYWGPRLVNDLWKPKEIYITENGTSSDDQVAPDGKIYDTDRVMYLRNYLTQLHRAIAEGVPVRGYFLWSLLDNFEWADGYSKRFGITYVDFKTQKRTPKLSADFYKQVIRENQLV